MNEIRLCIIILNWNSSADTNRAISSLGDCDWAVTVVDNASNDPNEMAIILEAHPGATVLQTGQNLGYAGGMNVGLKWALANDFSHALLLNPDTLPSVSVIESMIQQSGDCAVVGTAQVTEDLSPYVSAALLKGSKPIPFTCATGCGQGHDIDIASGAALLLELNKAEQLDFIDEHFFHYKEEFDYCYRVGASGGKIRYSCGVPLIHKRGGSLPGTSPTAQYYSYRNELLFLRKHFGPLGWVSGLGLFRNALLSIVKSPGVATSVIKGLYHGLRGISGPVSSLKRVGASN